MKGDVVNIVIKIDGKPIKSTYQLFSAMVHHEVNKIPFARILIQDGDIPNQKFEASNAPEFVPGKIIEIQVGDADNQSTIFIGTITKHSIRYVSGRSSFLEVEARDKVVKLTMECKSTVFSKVSDDDVFNKIFNNAGLKCKADKTQVKYDSLVQYNVTDWDFILNRAEINGLFVIVSNGEVLIKAPDIKPSGKKLVSGEDVIEFECEIDARYQPKESLGYLWSSKDQKQTTVKAKEPQLPKAGNLKASDLSKGMGFQQFENHNLGQSNEKEASTFTNARLLKKRLAMIRGRVQYSGNSDFLPGMVIELVGWSDRFNGEVFISAVRHEVVNNVWNTQIQIGFDNEWFVEQQDITPLPAAGLIPSISGLQIGKVLQLKGDPEKEERIKVQLPTISEKQEGVWARHSMFDAGPNRGSYFRPEIGDEVIVGFINNDPRNPVILGAMHSSANPSPLKATDQNDERGYQSRSKMKLSFDDKKKNLVFSTPNGNEILISEENKGIQIKDENGNEITMSPDGIAIKSSKDLILESSADTSIKGGNISHSADQQFKADGMGGLELSSSATSILKGAMVQIN